MQIATVVISAKIQQLCLCVFFLFREVVFVQTQSQISGIESEAIIFFKN